MLKHGWQWQCWQQLTVEVDNLARKKEFLNGYRRQSLMWLSWAQTEAHSRHWAQRPWTHYQQCGFSFSVWQNLRGLLSVIVHQCKHCTDAPDMPGLNRTLRRTSAHTVYTTLCHSYCNSVAGHCNGISLSCNSAPSWWCIYRPCIKCSTEVVVVCSTYIHKPHPAWGNSLHRQCLPQCTVDTQCCFLLHLFYSQQIHSLSCYNLKDKCMKKHFVTTC